VGGRARVVRGDDHAVLGGGHACGRMPYLCAALRGLRFFLRRRGFFSVEAISIWELYFDLDALFRFGSPRGSRVTVYKQDGRTTS
jgi:hypothetical protein